MLKKFLALSFAVLAFSGCGARPPEDPIESRTLSVGSAGTYTLAFVPYVSPNGARADFPVFTLQLCEAGKPNSCESPLKIKGTTSTFALHAVPVPSELKTAASKAQCTRLGQGFWARLNDTLDTQPSFSSQPRSGMFATLAGCTGLLTLAASAAVASPIGPQGVVASGLVAATAAGAVMFVGEFRNNFLAAGQRQAQSSAGMGLIQQNAKLLLSPAGGNRPLFSAEQARNMIVALATLHKSGYSSRLLQVSFPLPL